MEENKANVKKLTLIAVSALLFCVIVGALIFVFGKTDDTFSLEGKSYVLEDPDGKNPTYISFKDGKFGLEFSPISSYFGAGDYKIEGDVLTLPTYDDRYVYRFFIKDGGDRLVFDGENSSDMVWFSLMKDGSEFIISENRVPELSGKVFTCKYGDPTRLTTIDLSIFSSNAFHLKITPTVLDTVYGMVGKEGDNVLVLSTSEGIIARFRIEDGGEKLVFIEGSFNSATSDGSMLMTGAELTVSKVY